MTTNAIPKGDVADQVQQQAETLVTAGTQGYAPIQETFHAEVQNGEQRVGYQYLHGSNSLVGDFDYRGDSWTEAPTGTSVHFKLDFTWNDIIDPEPQYFSDRWKSLVAESITMGGATPYNIHICWSREFDVQLDASGKATTIQGGWPRSGP